MMVLRYKYLLYGWKLTTTDDISKSSDAGKISEYAVNAEKCLTSNGIILEDS